MRRLQYRNMRTHARPAPDGRAMRRRARVDENQRAIVDWLRRVGTFVQSLAPLGDGVPDLLVGFRGVWYVFEIKDGTKPPSAHKLTDDEIGWHTIANLHAPTYT